MVATRPAPERSVVQRQAALTRANEIRSQRSEIKADMKARKVSAHDLLLDPPDCIKTMKLIDLMLAMPKYGRVKVNKILTQCRISPSKTVGGLSPRQSREIIGLLKRYTP